MTQKIEEALAHTATTLDELSDIVARQDAELQRLSKLVDLLIARDYEREQRGGGIILADDRPPPHY